ncbi:uncharacterized protein LOC110059024 isoform X1 [Orbicella faveolata]|uniref:uncharacterized protein LOC110059024 isoform X1 n=1 Tax=Orbicella faveolata TaxID=48498 RepID=UPI0009E62B01|nr:uncharacterized protein LOC110059024 isoform X1 [Orbicella faveolata]
MEAIAVKILLFLLIVGLIASNVVDGSRPMHINNINGEEDHDHSDKTSTHKHRNQDGTVIGEEDHERSSKTSSYKDYNQDDAEVRAVGPQMVFNNPNQPCYTQFFAGGQQPTGLRTGQNLQNIRYICQMVNQQTYYGTMFDQALGIAVFSAYTLTQANANFPNRPRPTRWTQTPGSHSLAIYKIRQ